MACVRLLQPVARFVFAALMTATNQVARFVTAALRAWLEMVYRQHSAGIDFRHAAVFTAKSGLLPHPLTKLFRNAYAG